MHSKNQSLALKEVFSGKRFNFVLSFTLLFLAGLIMYASVYSVNRAATQQVADRLCVKEWYWGEEILADHPLYPILMVRDKIRLHTANQKDQPEIRMQLAHVRMRTARALAQKGEYDLAITTLSKSQQYALFASKQARAQDPQNQDLPEKLDSYLYQLSQLLQTDKKLSAPVIDSLQIATKSELSRWDALATAPLKKNNQLNSL